MRFNDLKIYLRFNLQCSLKVPEKYEKWLRASSSVKGKSLPASPSGEE